MQYKKAILYTLTAALLFSAGRFSNYLQIEKPGNKPDEHIVKIYVFDQRQGIERIIDREISDDIVFRIRRDNEFYRRTDEDIYLGIDLDIIKEKYEKAKEWFKDKVDGY